MDSRIKVGLIALLFVAGAAGGAALQAGFIPVSQNDSGLPVNDPGGPSATVTGNFDFSNQTGAVDDSTLQYNTSAGSALFESTGDANATLPVSSLDGSWVNLSDVDTTSADLTVRTGEVAPATISGSVTELRYPEASRIDTTDDEPDIYLAASGSGQITLNNLPASTELSAATASGTLFDTATTDSSGTATFDVSSTSGREGVILFSNHLPNASNLSPSDNAMLDSRDTTFSVDVSDPEFATAQGDSVEARLFVDNQQVGSQTVTSNSTVSIDHQMSEGGSHTYHWELEDSYGGLTTTNQRTINVPSELSIYNVSAPSQLIDNAGEVELTFYTYDESNEVFTRSVTDGTVNLTGLPVDQEITVTANVDGYYSRQTIIESLYQQQAVYLLNDSRNAYETEFELNDNTGGSFSKNEPRIIVERALNKSGDTQWVNVTGGRFGVNNYRTTLEAQERYRLTVKNSQGDSRVFYPYDAEAAQVVPLDVGSVSAEAAGGDSYTAEAAYRNESGTPRVSFEYVDEANQTTSVSVNVYERGNQSNQLVNDTFTGEYGTLDLVWTIPENSTATSWVVEYSADRDGNTLNGRQIVGPRQTVLDQIPVWLKTIISVGSVFIVAGLFSRANGAIGGVITAAVGGMWWFVGFLPAGVGVGVVALSFLTAGMIFVRDAGGGYS